MAAGDSVTSCCTSTTNRNISVCDAVGGCKGNASRTSCTNVLMSCGTTRSDIMLCQISYGCTNNSTATICAGCSGQASASQTITVSEPDNYWQKLPAENYSEFLPTNGSGIIAYAKPQSGKSTNFSSALASKTLNLTYAVNYWYRIPLHKTFPYDTNTKAKYTGSNITDTYVLDVTYNYTNSYFAETVDHGASSSLDSGYFFEATDQVSSNGIAYTTKTTNANKVPLWPTEYIDINYTAASPMIMVASIQSVTFKFPANHDIACPSADVTNNIHWTLYCVPSSAFNSVSTKNLDNSEYNVATATDTWNINNPSPTVSYNYTNFIAYNGSGSSHSHMFCVKVVIDNYLNQGDIELWQLNVLESAI